MSFVTKKNMVSSNVLCDHFVQFPHMVAMPRFSRSFLKDIWQACDHIVIMIGGDTRFFAWVFMCNSF